MKKLILLIILQILFWGCTSTPLSIKTELNKFPVQGDSKRISAEACGFQFLLLIPIGINDRQVRAYTLLQMQAVGGTL
ncbi:MAG TPA: hypothetical protein PKK05_26620, partial [Leptospiraceae bacterium]|nr:hypothetical protein [Leptospiraceae bacterium]